MVDKLVNSELNAKRIANVESCFGISGIPLAVPGRVLVGEGVLTKICKKKPKSRQFFLFNDILVYGTILINKKKYAAQKIIPLESLTIENLQDEVVMKNGWLIKTASKSFAVYAGSPSEKAEWIRHIKKCSNDLLEQTGRKPQTEHAAVWVPDSIAKKCMSCKTTQFTTFIRRHHCRKCGAVVCGYCSKNRVIILGQSNKPVRVCDECYKKLNDHLSRGKKSPTCSKHEQALNNARIDDRVEEWISLANEKLNERMKSSATNDSSSSDPESANESIEKIETRLPIQTVNDDHNEVIIDSEQVEQIEKTNETKEDVGNLSGNKNSYQNDETSESEDDNDLSSSIEDILDTENKKPTFYNMKSKDGLQTDLENCEKELSNLKVDNEFCAQTIDEKLDENVLKELSINQLANKTTKIDEVQKNEEKEETTEIKIENTNDQLKDVMIDEKKSVEDELKTAF